MTTRWRLGDQPPDATTNFRDHLGVRWCEILRSPTKPRVWYCDSASGVERYWDELLAFHGPLTEDSPAEVRIQNTLIRIADMWQHRMDEQTADWLDEITASLRGETR